LVSQAIGQTVISDSAENWYKYRVSSIYCYEGWEPPASVINYIGLCSIPFDSVFAYVYMVSTDSGCFPILILKRQRVWLGFRYIDGKENCNYNLCVKGEDSLLIEVISRVSDTVCLNDTCMVTPFVYHYIRTDTTETLINICTNGSNDVIVNVYGDAVYYEARAYPFFNVLRDHALFPITSSWIEWVSRKLMHKDSINVSDFLEIYFTSEAMGRPVLPEEYKYALIYTDSINYGYGSPRCPVVDECYIDYGYLFRWGANSYLSGWLTYFNPYETSGIRDTTIKEGVYWFTTRRKTDGTNSFHKGYIHPTIPWSFYH